MFFSMINVITLGVFAWIKQSRKRAVIQMHISRRIYALLFSGAGTGILMIAGLLVRSNSKVTETARRAMMIATVVVTLSYCAACLMMIFVTESRDNYKALSLISQNIIESQQQYYTLVNEKQQEIRSIRHEMKNHLACIRSLYLSDKLPEMEQYIRQLIETSEYSAGLFDTGNDIVNAILNDAQSRYQKDHIAIRLEGGFPPVLYIAPMDLCVIFANLISNAVEAILKMDKREENNQCIDVKISSYKDDLYIDVKNPTAREVMLSGGRLMTTKNDKSLHGFGVQNVIQRVEKYHGTYQFHMDQDRFMVEIFMKNKV
jgi:sensor histidine kinase regulating citrate/malate metabolism